MLIMYGKTMNELTYWLHHLTTSPLLGLYMAASIIVLVYGCKAVNSEWKKWRERENLERYKSERWN